MRRVSVKKAQQRSKERGLARELLQRANGRCESCKQLPDWRGLAKHEDKHRSQGGDPLDPGNCLLLCGRCHSREHLIKEV